MTVGPTNPMVSMHGTKFYTTTHPTVLPLQTIGTLQPTTVASAFLVLSMLKGISHLPMDQMSEIFWDHV